MVGIKWHPKSRASLQRQLHAQRAAFQVWLKPISHKVILGLATLVLLVSQVIPFLQPQLEAQRYNLADANNLLPRQSTLLAKDLAFSQKDAQYNFNSNYSPSSSSLDNGGAKSYGGSKIKAVAHKDPTKGVTVTDPLNNVDFTLTPKFDLMDAEQDSNRVYYPLKNNSGWLVYTMQANQVSEDLVLTHATGDTLKLDYDLGLGDALQARMMSDGSVGIYGSDLPISGNVSTSNAKDAALLAKVRQNAKKTKLLFTLPRPVIRQTGANTPGVQAKYILKGSSLTLDVKGLKQGNYPIDIDPSVYVQSARGLMYGNNETNINFDTTNDLFEKTPVSGGNIRDGVTQTSWSATTSLPANLWASGVAVSGGYIYVVGGSTGTLTATSAKVYWAQLNVNSTTPVGTWATNTGYDLPTALRNVSVVAYNDYLYAIGGNSGSAVVSTVSKLHLAASGEPTPSWVTGGNTLPANAGKQYGGAVAYQNEIYIAGGQTAATGQTGRVNGYAAAINPDGTTGAWNAITSLPAALWGFSMATYNGYIYVVGGSVLLNESFAIYYAQITGPGTIGAWQTNANPLTDWRLAIGGNFMTIWAGYMYLSGGCGDDSTNSTCTNAPLSDVQEASINADGSVSNWTTLQYYNTGTSAFADISQVRQSYGLVSFGTRNDASAANAGGTLYAVGGCLLQNSGTGNCTTTTNSVTAANISSEGDIGPAQTTTAMPTAAGSFAAAIVVNNGFIYDVGGCAHTTNGTTNGCGTTVNKIYYAQLNANGTVGTWGATATVLPANRAGMGATVIGNVLYAFGGTTGASNGSSTNAYSALIQSDGNITTAFASTTGLAAAALYPFVFSTINPATPTQAFIYSVGGCTQTTGTTGIGCNGYANTTRRCTATLGSTTLTCANYTTFTLATGTGIAAGAIYGNYVYLSSGANAGTSGTAGSWGGQTNLTYYAKINSSGDLSAPPGKTGTNWATTTAKLADNGVTDASSDNAPGQRRRAAAFAVNGYLYVLGGHDANAASGSGDTLQDMEIGKINPSTGDIASFTDNYYQVTPRWDFKGAAANGFIYAVGGCSNGSPPANCTEEDMAVQYMQVYNNYSGTPASYGTTTTNSTARVGSSSAIYNGYIYNAGGCTNIGCTTFSNTVEYAQIDPDDGTIGAWTTTSGTSNMGATRTFFKLLASGGYLYALGGQTGAAASTAVATTEKVQLTAGVPGAWSSTTSMNNARSGLDAVIYNGYVYASGGVNAAGTSLATVEYSLIGTGSLGAWTTSGNSFTTARSGHMSVAYNGTLYIMGGFDGTNYLSNTQFAQINSNGTIGTFSPSMPLPQAVRQGSAFAANGYLYVVGGRSAAAICTNNTYVSSLTANSTVASGNVPNGLGAWGQTAVVFGAAATSARYGAATSYANGKAYIMGGGCAAFTSTSYFSTLQSQPQTAQYSYAIDAISDVFPSKSLFNGIDNGIGASWILDYRSSTDAAAAWGVSTNYGKTTLGTPQAYNPLDGSGTNTSFARYYWIELTIDASQAFGFPEDVSRGPTIANLTLQFTANPAQRLRHGKTFINNVQQPLDAPF